jgi:hypothetical protein
MTWTVLMIACFALGAGIQAYANVIRRGRS